VKIGLLQVKSLILVIISLILMKI